MKNHLLLMSCLACCCSAKAQYSFQQKQNEHMALSRLALRSQSDNNMQQKPTGLQYRVIGQTIPSYVPQDVDSFVYKYSGAHGSRFDFEDETFLYNDKFESLYAPVFMNLQVQDPLNLLADSIISYAGNVVPNIKVASYRPDNKMTKTASLDLLNDGSVIYSRGQINQYNPQGYLTVLYTTQFQSNQTDTISKRAITYNSDFTRVLTDSFFIHYVNGFASIGTIEYYYNATNKLDSAKSLAISGTQSGYDTKASFEYRPDGLLRKLKTETLGNPFSSMLFIDTFGYTPGIPYCTWHESRNYYIEPTYTSANSSRLIYYPGVSGLPDSCASFYNDDNVQSWQPNQTAIFTYTSFGAPDYITFRYPYTQYTTRNKFYYESYDDGLSVREIHPGETWKVYPNPFTDHINIYTAEKGISSKLKLSICNISGQQVISRAMTLQSVTQLNLPALAPGIYTLHIEDNAGGVWNTKIIRR